MLAYMTIGDDHMLATESKQITTTETDKMANLLSSTKSHCSMYSCILLPKNLQKKDTMKIASSIIIRQTI